MKYKKINQHRRLRREVWEPFSDESPPIEPELFVDCVIKKAQTLFERYDTLYQNLCTTHIGSIKQFKILSGIVERIHFSLLSLCDLYKHEVAKVEKGVREKMVELIQKLENLAIETWKKWFFLSSVRYPPVVHVNPAFN